MDQHRLHRILHVVDSLAFGGLERVVTDLACAQAAHGHRVAVFGMQEAEHDSRGFRAELERNGVPVVAGGKRGTLDLRVLHRLRLASLGEGTDVVHSHNFVPSYYAAIATMGAPAAPALVNTCHNMGTRLANRRLRRLYRWSLGRTDCIALVGQQVHARLVSDGVVPPERAEVVLNGVPVERHAGGQAPRLRARAALGIAPDALVLGSVGRLVALKNHSLLLDAVPGLLAQHPGLYAVLVGDGPLMDELRARVAGCEMEGRVKLMGARDDVPALLAGFDLFVLPSRTEGLSIALLEASAAGLPMVATDVGGNAEVVQHGRTGLIVPADDRPALQAALDALLRDADMRRAMGTAAREWVQAHGSIDAMRRRYDGLYARALEARRARGAASAGRQGAHP